MSKMSQLHAELTSQAYELGYTTLEDAFNDGWEVDYDQLRLRKVVDIQEEAHRAWLKEREDIYKRLSELYNELVYIDIDEEYLATINDTIDFIKKGEI